MKIFVGGAVRDLAGAISNDYSNYGEMGRVVSAAVGDPVIVII
jgi:hypothetical protein